MEARVPQTRQPCCVTSWSKRLAKGCMSASDPAFPFWTAWCTDDQVGSCRVAVRICVAVTGSCSICLTWKTSTSGRFRQLLDLLDVEDVHFNIKGVTGIRLESGAREETGRFRDVKRCVATEDRTRVSGISLLRHNR